MNNDIAVVPDQDDPFDARQRAILVALQGGCTRTAAADAVGIDRTTLFRWMQRDATFSSAVKAAEADAEIDFTEIIRTAAKGTQVKKRTLIIKPDGTKVAMEEYVPGDWRAAAWWLEHRKRTWKAPEPLDLSKLTDDQIIALLEEESAEGGDEAESEDAGEGGAAAPLSG